MRKGKSNLAMASGGEKVEGFPETAKRGGAEISVPAGRTDLASALRAHDIPAREREGQVIDAIMPDGTGVLFISEGDLACMARDDRNDEAASIKHADSIRTCLAEPSFKSHTRQGPRGRCEALKQHGGGVLLVEHSETATVDQMAALQLEMSISHTSYIPIIPIKDKEAFVMFLKVRMRKVVPKISRSFAGCSDVKVRQMLAGLPGMNALVALTSLHFCVCSVHDCKQQNKRLTFSPCEADGAQAAWQVSNRRRCAIGRRRGVHKRS